MKAISNLLNIPGLSKARWVFIKELRSFFGSNLPPISVGLIAFFCGIVSVILSLADRATYDGVTRFMFHLFYLIIMGAAIFLSMSAFVNEKKQGTMELLYTLPVSDLELVLGKFLLGAVFLSLMSLAMTLVYIIGIADAPFHLAISGVLGLSLVGLYAYSVGLFASSITNSYLVALLVSVAILLVVDVSGFLAGLLPEPFKGIFTHLHGLHQFTPFTRGRIPLKGTIFFGSLSTFFLFLTVKVLESRRWRG